MKSQLAKKIIKSVILFPAMLLFGIGMSGCASPQPRPLDEQIAMPEEGDHVAIIRTNHGDIYIRFFPDYAPMASANFITLAERGFYDDSIFHRAIEGFMIQGGDPTGDPPGTGGRSAFEGGAVFADEFTPNRRHIRGAVAMANRGPNTNSSQFFIVQNSNLNANDRHFFSQVLLPENRGILLEDGTPILERYIPAFLEHYMEYGGTPHLDFRHTVFGQVFRGMDVVDSIAEVAVDGNDRPIEPVVVHNVEIILWTP